MSSAGNEKPSQNGSARDATRTDQLIGELIRKRRIDVGLTQDELARRINVTARQLQKYEGGTNRISASRLVECAQALGVPVVWFFERLPRMTDGQDAGREEAANEQRLVDHYRQLPNQVREKLIAIAEVLAQDSAKKPKGRNG
jgi:transcriptional regulator with XRE-family HTH domain